MALLRVPFVGFSPLSSFRVLARKVALAAACLAVCFSQAAPAGASAAEAWPFEAGSLYIYRPGEIPYLPDGDPISQLVFNGMSAEGGFDVKGEKPVRKRRDPVRPITREELERIDDTALSRMGQRRRGAMPEGDIAYHRGLGRKIPLSRQLYMTFLEDARALRPLGEREILTSLKMVRGQELATGVTAELPVQMEFEGIELGPERFRFEFSRASNVAEAEYLRFAFSYMVLQAAQETLLMGGKLEDAAIYAHYTDPRVARRMVEAFPLKLHREPKAGHTVVRGALSDILNDERFDFGRLYGDLGRYSRGLGGLSVSKVIEFLFEMKDLFRRQYEVIDSSSGAKLGDLGVLDQSRLTRLRFEAICGRYGVEPARAREALRHDYGYGETRVTEEPGREVALEWLPSESSRLKLEEVDLSPIAESYQAELGTQSPVRRMIESLRSGSRFLRAKLKPTAPPRYLTAPW